MSRFDCPRDARAVTDGWAWYYARVAEAEPTRWKKRPRWRTTIIRNFVNDSVVCSYLSFSYVEAVQAGNRKLDQIAARNPDARGTVISEESTDR